MQEISWGMLMGKTAFVTGAEGLIGRHLVQALLDAQWSVHVLVRSATAGWTQGGDIVIHQGTLDSPEMVEEAMPKHVDAVFHLAGKSSMWSGDRHALIRDNVDATRNLLQAAQRCNAQRVVMTSTLGAFQNNQAHITENSPLRPLTERNPYLHTKLLADALLTDAANQGLSVVSMHPAHILGTYDKTGWGTLFDEAAQGKLNAAPRGSGSFCSVDSVACAYLAAATHPHPSRRYVLAQADASYLELFTGIARRVKANPVLSTMPNIVLKTLALRSQACAYFTARAPTLNWGLAAILASSMHAHAGLAQQELGYQTATLDSILDVTHVYWDTHRHQAT